MKRLIVIITGLLLSFGAFPVNAQAITSYDVTNLPVMFLETQMAVGATTGIQLQAPERNRSTFTFPTTSGGILRIYQGWKEEFIHYTSASVNSTTKIVTLSGVSRELCISQFENIVSCGSGLSFGRGAYVELATASWLLNLKANIDRANRFRGSGSILCTSTTQPCIGVGQYSTAQIAAFTYASGGMLALDQTRGVPQMYIGGAWTDLTGTGSNNATTTSRGVVQIATTGAILARTATGSSGAFNVITANRITTDYRGDTDDYDIVALSGATARIDTDLLPNIPVTKLNSGTSASSSTYWRGDGTWVNPSTALSTLVYASGSGSSNVSGDTNEHDFTRGAAPMSWTLTGSTVSTGTIIVIKASGQFSNPSGGANPVIRAKIGSTTVGAVTLSPPSTATYYFDFETTITVQAIGANGKTRASTRATGNLYTPVVMDSQHDTGINFTSNNAIKLSAQLGTASSNVVMLHALQVYKYTPAYTN